MSTRGWKNAALIAAGEDYEVMVLIEHFRLTYTQAQSLVAQHGKDRATLAREARRLTGR